MKYIEIWILTLTYACILSLVTSYKAWPGTWPAHYFINFISHNPHTACIQVAASSPGQLVASRAPVSESLLVVRRIGLLPPKN